MGKGKYQVGVTFNKCLTATVGTKTVKIRVNLKLHKKLCSVVVR